MAAARLVMGHFFHAYEEILLDAGVTISLMKVYVDDGRQITSLLKKGMRYSREKKRFEWDRKRAERDGYTAEGESEDRQIFGHLAHPET